MSTSLGNARPKMNRIKMPRVYIILVNWNGWRDTIECLESLFRLDYPNFSIIVCDNGSSDGSLAHIRDWASGSTQAECSSGELQRLTRPPVRKPLECVVLRNSDVDGWKDQHPKLILLETCANLGFAGGNNVGLSYALSRGDFHYIWLLNNDTVVEPDSLAALVARASSSDRIGMCGSKILYYNSPNTVQTLGGSVFNRWFARGGAIGMLSSADACEDTGAVERRLAYIAGASMLISRSFIDRVGLMNEDYFLYFEELDWAIRAKDIFTLAYSADSIVYHKEGSSIGTNAAQTADQSPVAEYYAARNRVRFTLRYFPYAIAPVLAALLASAIKRLARRRWTNVDALIRGVLGLPAREWITQKPQSQHASLHS